MLISNALLFAIGKNIAVTAIKSTNNHHRMIIVDQKHNMCMHAPQQQKS